MAEEKLLYRFRKLKHIFDYKELEKQTIYFAPVEQVNDPMEGHKIMIFDGDLVVWKNLFRHYIMCIFEISIINDIDRKNTFNITDINYMSIGGFNGNVHLQYLLSLVYNEFFSIFDSEIKRIVNERNNITTNELEIYLSDILNIVILIIDYVVSNNTRKISENNKIEIKNQLNNSIDFFKNNHNNNDSVFEFKHNKKTIINLKDIANYFKNSFVSDYIKCLKKIVSANELIACFSDNPNNFLMWSHYSDSHKGVCLIFNTKEYKNLPSILLSEYSANEYNYYSFYQVKYQPYNQPINFFSNIHHTMMSIYRDYWYIDSYLIKKGEKSKLYHDYVYDIYNEESMKLYDKNNPFFNEYLENTKLQIIFKLQHWKEEREYRLILFDYIKQISEIKGEIYKYKFESLQGIIFGLNTPFNERNQIINIIKNKCLEENRTDFKFYEMQIDETIGKLKQVELNINLFDTPPTEPNHE